MKKLEKVKIITGIITGIVSVIISIIVIIVDKCAQQSPPPIPESPKPEPIVVPPVVVVVPPVVVAPPENKPAPPSAPPAKTEFMKLTVTMTEIASALAFDGDVQITLSKVHEPYQQVFGKITVYSSGESRKFEELTTGIPQKIGNYVIYVEKIGHDYAEFRIVGGQR